MTMMLNVKDKYVQQLENFINSLPKDAIEIKDSLDIEISKRVGNYRNREIKTIPFDTGLNSIREKLVSQI